MTLGTGIIPRDLTFLPDISQVVFSLTRDYFQIVIVKPRENYFTAGMH